MNARMKSVLAAGLMLMLGTTTANAALFNFSYDTGLGILSGALEGELQGDNDTVLVSAILGTPQFDGSDFLPLPFVGPVTEYIGTFDGLGPGIVTISGGYMDIIACNVDECEEGFLFFAQDGEGEFSSSLGLDGEFVADNWTLQMVVETPEPTTLALLGLGLVGMGMRRRKTA